MDNNITCILEIPSRDFNSQGKILSDFLLPLLWYDQCKIRSDSEMRAYTLLRLIRQHCCRVIIFSVAWTILSDQFDSSALNAKDKPAKTTDPKKSNMTPLPIIPHGLPSSECQEDWAAPLGGPGYFGSKNQYYYHLGNIGTSNKKQKSGTKLFRYGLFKIDINNAKSLPMMTMKLPTAEAFIPYGQENLSAIIAFVFNKSSEDCINGKARFIGFPVNSAESGSSKKKLSVIQGRGVFQIVETPDFPVVWDFSKKALLEFDFQTMQSRSMVIRLANNEVPIYFDHQKRRYYAWHFMDERKQKGLVAYDGSGKIAGRLLFQSGDKLLQQKNYFGVAKIRHSDNSIMIIELERWSGIGSKKSYSLHIPKDHRVISASIKAHFSKKIAVISGFTKKSRKSWRKLYIYDYEKSWQLSVLTPPPGQYISHESISDDGHWIMAELRHFGTDLTASLSLFSTQTRKWVTIKSIRQR